MLRSSFVKMAAVPDVGILLEIINFWAFVVVFVYVLSFWMVFSFLWPWLGYISHCVPKLKKWILNFTKVFWKMKQKHFNPPIKSLCTKMSYFCNNFFCLFSVLEDKTGLETNQNNLQTRLSLLANNQSILTDNLTRIISQVEQLSAQVNKSCVIWRKIRFSAETEVDLFFPKKLDFNWKTS